MNIIGKSPGGYLVEATERELANCAGFSFESKWREAYPDLFEKYDSGGCGYNYRVRMCVRFDVKTPHEMFERLRDQEEKVRNTVGVLTGLVAILNQSVPSFASVPEPASEVKS